MPRIICRKVFVLVHPDGEKERLDTPEQLESALALESEGYRVEQADLVELVP